MGSKVKKNLNVTHLLDSAVNQSVVYTHMVSTVSISLREDLQQNIK